MTAVKLMENNYDNKPGFPKHFSKGPVKEIKKAMGPLNKVIQKTTIKNK